MSVVKNHGQEEATGWRKMGKVQYMKQLEIHTIDRGGMANDKLAQLQRTE